MPDEQPPELDLDRKGAEGILMRKAGIKRREADELDRIAEMVELRTPLGELYAEAWSVYSRDGSSLNMEVAIVSGVNLEIAEAVAAAYLRNPAELQAQVTAIIEKAVEGYEAGLLAPPVQPEARPPGIPTLVASSRTFTDFKRRVLEAVGAQIQEDAGR